jgi:transglutaminase-like putative cysteine protease
MARTAALYVPAAVLLLAAWTRLEASSQEGTAILLALLALGPALVRPWWARIPAALAACVVALHAAFDVSLLDARPFDDERNFFGPLLTSMKDGVLEYYDVTVPFAPGEQPLMHGVVLMAVFAFCLAVGLALAARRPVAAALVLLVGAAWPVTLVPRNELHWGSAVLAVTLILLAAAGSRPPRAVRTAAIAAGVLVVASLAAATQPAVAKGEFLDWKRWDFYDRPDDPVGVRYVWDANYDGIRFPEKKTKVLTIEGPDRSLYWRATTLDDFREDRWVENLPIVRTEEGPTTLLADPLLPARASRQRDWVRAKVTVHALQDSRLVGAATPMRWDPTGLGVVEYRPGNVAVLQQPFRRGQSWTVWSYAPQPTPKQLARTRLPRERPNSSLGRYIEVGSTLDVPTFGTPGRESKVEEIFADENVGPFYEEYRPLYETARRVVGDVSSPYAAVIALETWFRSGGEFVYDEQPPVTPPGGAPLVDFVTRTKRGYCQQYAGAMALMLRYLGIPARVAAGFTSGTYDGEKRRFTVTDHNAHTWVEVWFQGWGWLPFDPTPARGELSGQVSSASSGFNIQEALAELERGRSGQARGPSINILRERLEATGARGPDVPGPLGAIDFGRERGASLVRLLAIVLLSVAALIVLAKLAVRRSRFLTSDPRRLAAACRSDLADFLRDQGLSVGRSATLGELGETLRRSFQIDAGRFVAAAGEARYGPPGRAAGAARRARRELRAVRRQLRRSLRARDRAAGLLSVRSLGFGAGSRG